MKAALVLMAAGLGSRYGGNKQTDGLGPNGEILMEYAVFDAVKAGFTKLVFIIKEDMRPWMEDFCATRLSGYGVEIRYAVQSMANAPHGRVKPYGTVHAVLSARDAVTEPFVIINADDYYGPEAFREAFSGLAKLENRGQALSVPYMLKNTVSPHGAVTRGIFECLDGKLVAVHERYRVCLNPDGSIFDSDENVLIDPDSLVSMNMWGFRYDIFEDLKAEFDAFLAGTDGGKNGEEYPIPVFVDKLMAAGALEISLMPTRGQWFGVTYREDRPAVKEKLISLHTAGTYPEKLGK